MKKYCLHDGICLLLAVHNSEMSRLEFFEKTGLNPEILGNIKRLDSETKELSALVLRRPVASIFAKHLEKIWYIHHPFPFDQLRSFAGLN